MGRKLFPKKKEGKEVNEPCPLPNLPGNPCWPRMQVSHFFPNGRLPVSIEYPNKDVVHAQNSLKTNADPSFRWFQNTEQTEKQRQAEAKKEAFKRQQESDIIGDVSQRDPNANRYPYRYSSAGPAPSGMTGKERCLGRCRRRHAAATAKPKNQRPWSYRDVYELEGYQTSEMQARLKPLQALERPPKGRVAPSLLRPLVLPPAPRHAFSAHVSEVLHAHARKHAHVPHASPRMAFWSRDSRADDLREWDENHHDPQLSDRKQQQRKKRPNFCLKIKSRKH